ncbi:hypothetical protein CFC21_049202 [Triticum aestivum]|uniref:Protein kinase domain-containing protein n=3 Tax=Triticum aestivum TaxID=4565 RepID=A0A9R1G269_WHEAT|nr:LRR receptor-like serine/threonine-protein kinase HSL2 isoform X1 [Triticum aestivum]KAF7039149.1 hypothetical protein CFC21_049202 [Triticum aestivum]
MQVVRRASFMQGQGQLAGRGLVAQAPYGWFRRGTSRRSCSLALRYSEQHIVGSIRDDNAMRSNGGTSRYQSALYRVQLQDAGAGGTSARTVLVKKLSQNENESTARGLVDLDGRCQSEVNLLGGIRHDNIINLVGSIWRDTFILLVYDHMDNGSLHQWLHPGPVPLPLPEAERRQTATSQLDWPTRRSIAIGVARGLCYLHHGRSNYHIVHHNINSTSILLDRDLRPKIAGFGLARVNLAGLDHPVPASELTAANIFGYTAPEYATVVTEKVDVYSFGVVLLELVTGRVANEAVPGGHLATWARRHCEEENGRGFSEVVVDIRIPDRARHVKEMAAVFRLGVECTIPDPGERPPMLKVLCRLRRRRG